MRLKIIHLVSSVLLLSNINVHTQTPFLLKDIFAGSGDSSPRNLTDVNGTLFFTARTANHGIELWKSNGTPASTVLVKDIHTGTANANPAHLTNVNGTLFFAATDAANGTELWKSDGTEVGTVLVKDIYPGTNSSRLNNFVNINGTLFFSATDGTNGIELWKSDGTESGTIMVKDIRPGSASMLGNSEDGYFTNVNGTLFFAATNGSNGTELWKSDGTGAGTVQVKDIRPGVTSSTPRNLASAENTLYFWADAPGYGHEIWKSDGTELGTVMVKDINVGSWGAIPSSSLGDPINVICSFNEGAFFVANNGNSGVGSELWKTDGTEAGTVLVKDIRLGAMSSDIQELTEVNGILFFSATDGNAAPYHGQELWKSDGTEAGTVLVKDIVPGTVNSNPGYLTPVGNHLFFAAGNGSSRVLWKSDGTEAGTMSLGPESSPAYITHSGGFLYYSAYQSGSGTELWVLHTGIMAVEEKETGNSVTVYPNPNDGIFQIEIPGLGTPANLKVLNTAGQTVHAAQIYSENTTVDLSGLSDGTYILLLNTDKGMVQKKIIIR